MTQLDKLIMTQRRIRKAYKKYRYDYPELARMYKRNMDAIDQQIKLVSNVTIVTSNHNNLNYTRSI